MPTGLKPYIQQGPWSPITYLTSITCLSDSHKSEMTVHLYFNPPPSKQIILSCFSLCPKSLLPISLIALFIACSPFLLFWENFSSVSTLKIHVIHFCIDSFFLSFLKALLPCLWASNVAEKSCPFVSFWVIIFFLSYTWRFFSVFSILQLLFDVSRLGFIYLS